MGRVQDAVCDALAAEISSREQWDEVPEVLPVYYEGGRCRLGHLWLPDEIWGTGPPALVLAGLADAGASRAGLLQRVAPEALFGAAFRTEVWMVSAKAGTDLARRAEAAGGQVSTLPERVEARSIWCVDRAGTTYSVIQVRSETEVRRDVWYPKAGHPVSGRVPAALDKLVTAFLGVTLPARERL